MSYAVALPAGGLIGDRFLQRTYQAQLTRFARSPSIERDLADFISRAGEAGTAESLVKDSRLLRVALGAFGLEDEIGKRAFIRRVLEEGTLDPGSLANRLADPAWKEFSAALGYGDFGGTLGSETTRRELAEQYRIRQFEKAVGDVDVNLRLALNFRRELPRVATESQTDSAGWFRILGSRPLRTVIEGAFGLPESFGKLDIDKQREVLEDRARQIVGSASPRSLAEGAVVEQLVQRFLLNAQATAIMAAGTGGSLALQLLGGLGAQSQANLFVSVLGSSVGR